MKAKTNLTTILGVMTIVIGQILSGCNASNTTKGGAIGAGVADNAHEHAVELAVGRDAALEGNSLGVAGAAAHELFGAGEFQTDGAAGGDGQVADDVFNARIHGGLHYRFDMEAGARLGRHVSSYILRNELRPLHGQK